MSNPVDPSAQARPWTPDGPLIPVLGGATATGKSALALELAQAFGLELVSADAMMVYRELDIGTAKPTLAERALVRHHLLDVVDPDEAFSVAHYVRLAERAIGEILARGRLPLVVGGTGFYLRALTEGLPTTPAADPEAQRPFWERFERDGLDALEVALFQLSPADAVRAERNPRRLVRALEIWHRTGRSPSTFALSTPRYRYSKRRLERGADELTARIVRRTRAMFEAGLVAEVRGLLERYPQATTALQAIGYKEVRAALLTEITAEAASDTATGLSSKTTPRTTRNQTGNLADAPAAVTQATLRYAKRQATWFAKEPKMVTLEPAAAARWLAELNA